MWSLVKKGCGGVRSEMNELHYRGYVTLIHYSAPDNILYGKIEGIRDLVLFESDTCDGIVQEFHNAVDEYIKCKKEISNEQQV